MLAYKTAPKYLSLGIPLNRIIQYKAGMFTITLIKSTSPNGEKRLTKNTPITFPTNPSYGKIIHIPTTISAIRNWMFKKPIGRLMNPNAKYKAAVMEISAIFELIPLSSKEIIFFSSALISSFKFTTYIS
jgi:hypothetical protein